MKIHKQLASMNKLKGNMIQSREKLIHKLKTEMEASG